MMNITNQKCGIEPLTLRVRLINKLLVYVFKLKVQVNCFGCNLYVLLILIIFYILVIIYNYIIIIIIIMYLILFNLIKYIFNRCSLKKLFLFHTLVSLMQYIKYRRLEGSSGRFAAFNQKVQGSKPPSSQIPGIQNLK